MVMKISRSWLFCCKSHIHRLKQKEEGESFCCSFKGDRDVVSFPTCLFVGRAMWYGRDSEGGPLCEEEGERVSHRGFGSTFVVGPGTRHGIACHCCSQNSFVFSSSLALEMDPNDSFIFSWILWSLGCKSTADLSYSFQPLGRRHSKAAKEGGFHGHVSLPTTCIFIKAASFGRKDSEAGLQKFCKAMSDIHRRVVRHALLQANHWVVDPKEVRRGLLSFGSRKLETKKKKAFISKGGGLSVSIASKRKREWQGSKVVEEENNDDDCVKPSPLKRCTPPPK